MNQIDRREFIKLGLAAGSLLALGSSDLTIKALGKKETPQKVLILGLDGIDHRLLQRWMKERG